MYKVMLNFILLCVLTKGIYCYTDLAQYLQPYDINNGTYDDMDNNADHICTRTCVKGDHKICYYRFVIEKYVTMNGFCGNCSNTTTDCNAKYCVTADGFERSIIAINRQMPGPSIQVCQGDMLVVDVKNMLPGCETSIHWHGIRQVNYKFMDGVPMVNQCPIQEHEIFRYHFIVEDPGSFWYHSHSGLQKMEGSLGALTVREPKSDNPNADLYDYDYPSHEILVQEWTHYPADDLYPGLQKRDIDQLPQTYLINGKGISINGSIPLATFTVKQGFRYLFRIISGTCFQCQFAITIEKHDFLIIGADGPPTKPYKVNSCTMGAGERFRVVVNATQPKGKYWIQARAVGYCNSTRAYNLAILQYEGYDGTSATPQPGYDVTEANNPGLTVNPFNSNCTDESEITDGPCISDLRDAYATPEIIRGKPDHTIIWSFGFFTFNNNKPYTNDSTYPKFIAPPGICVASTVNGISHENPPSPLMSQWREIPDSVYCPEYSYSDSNTWNTEYRECTHVVQVPAFKLIELLILDPQNFGMSHPIHLHGYDFYICEQGFLPQNSTLNETLTTLLEYLDSDEREELPTHMVRKDTVDLTSGGYLVARIFTDNTGYWFFHCHFAYHLESGMAGVLKVGSDEDIPYPPEGFPRCGDYLPKLEDIEEYYVYDEAGESGECEDSGYSEEDDECDEC